MSSKTWTGSAGNLTGNWSNAADWSSAVPGSSDVARITAAGSTAYTVTLDLSSTTIGKLQINAANATLDISGNTLTVSSNLGSAIQIGSGGGQITMEGGTLAGTGGIDLSGGRVVGFGTISLIVKGSGIYQAQGGTLDLSNAVKGSAGGLEIAAGSGNILELDSTLASGAAVTFLGGSGVLDLNETSNSGFAKNLPINLTVGSDLVAADNDVIEFGSVTVSSASFNSSNDVLTVVTSGGTFTFNISAESGSLTGAIAHQSGNEVFLSTDPPCYLAGTRILTLEGEVAVEDLVIGDRVMTLSGEAKRIKWIGTRAYDPRFVDRNPDILPIGIRRGALGGGLPRRDLFVSPEHALFIDGMLVPAGALVNGVSIVQEWRGGTIAYYHVELAEHDVIYAEGVPAESFIDCGNRGIFQNQAEFEALYPEDESRPWAYCAPVVDSGPELEGVRRRIAEHSAALAEDTLWRGAGASAALASSGSAAPPAIIRLAAA